MTKKAARSGASESLRAEPPGMDESVDLGGLEDLLGYRLQLAYRVQLQRFASVGAAHNIRASQFSILNLVHCNPSIKQTDLAKALCKKHANVVTALDELQRRGLIARMPDPNDRRSRVLRLTPSGERLTLELIDRYAELHRELRKKFGAQQLDQLLELLQKFSRIGD